MTLRHDTAGYKNVYGQSANTANVVYQPLATTVLVDTVAPVAPSLAHCANVAGTPASPCTTSATGSCSTSCLHFRWAPVSDANSGVLSLRLLVVRSIGGGAYLPIITATVAVTDVAYTNCSLGLAPGSLVNASLEVTDKAGNVFTRAVPGVLLVDGTPPVAPATGVSNGATLGSHAPFSASTSSASVVFAAFVDAESSITSYSVVLVLNTSGETVGSVDTPTAGVVRLSALTLSCGSAYVWRVTATNAAGCSTTVSSPSFVADDSAPSVSGAVIEATVRGSPTGAALSCSSSATGLGVRFRGMGDTCSSVKLYQAALVSPSNHTNAATAFTTYTGLIQQVGMAWMSVVHTLLLGSWFGWWSSIQ